MPRAIFSFCYVFCLVAISINEPAIARSFADKAGNESSCVDQRLDDRYDRAVIKEPRSSGVQFWTFTCSDTFKYSADPSDLPEGFDQDRPVQLDVRFPQIDQPHNSKEKVFNRAVRELVFGYMGPSNDHTTDISIDVSVIENSDKAINLQIVEYWYAHGTAHGTGTTRNLVFLLSEGRFLKPKDLFDPKVDLIKILAPLCKRALEEQIQSFEPTVDLHAIELSLAEEGNVAPLPSGILVHFDPGGFGMGRAEGEKNVMIDWSDLTPYLNPKYQFLRATK